MKHKISAVAALVALATAAAPLAQSGLDPNINDKIRNEEAANSQIMRTMHFLTDVYGPRLTGSPNHKAAADWAVKQMTSWGFSNAHLEPWEFGHPGWANEHVEAHIVSPMKSVLVVQPLAWTPGTRGSVTAGAFNLVAPAPRHSAELTTYLDGIKAKVGAAVLVGKPAVVPVNFNAEATRLSDIDAKCRYSPDAATDPECQGRGGRGQRGGGAAAAPAPPDRLTARQVNTQIDDFLVANKAALRIDDAGRWNGIVTAPNNRTYDETKQTPTLVMRNDDFGRIARILADGTPVTLGFNIVNKWYPEGHTSYNTIGEIAGTDKKDEVVMLGGHLDSWHVATGATDNAIGCAVMMEAARILQALGVHPRRTIRVALWSGEEEGLLGSLAYVERHFRHRQKPKQPEFAKFDAYLNVDSGHRQGARPACSAGRGGRHAAQDPRPVQGRRRRGVAAIATARPVAPTGVVQPRRAAGESASARIRSTGPAHAPPTSYLRTDHRGRRERAPQPSSRRRSTSCVQDQPVRSPPTRCRRCRSAPAASGRRRT